MKVSLTVGRITVFELYLLEPVEDVDDEDEPEDNSWVVHGLHSTTDIAERAPVGFGYVEPEERRRR